MEKVWVAEAEFQNTLLKIYFEIIYHKNYQTIHHQRMKVTYIAPFSVNYFSGKSGMEFSIFLLQEITYTVEFQTGWNFLLSFVSE